MRLLQDTFWFWALWQVICIMATGGKKPLQVAVRNNFKAGLAFTSNSLVCVRICDPNASTDHGLISWCLHERKFVLVPYACFS